MELHIEYLITGLNYGGAELQLVQLTSRLAKKGARVGITTLLPPEAFVDECRAAGVEVRTLAMKRGVPDPRALLRLRGILSKSRPDILHCHMVHANLLGRLVRPLIRVPCVISTAHSIKEGGRGIYLAYRTTDRLADLTTHVSRTAAERYVRERIAAQERLIHVPNGVDTQLFRPDPLRRASVRAALGVNESDFVWLAVGRFQAAKDYPSMIRAFSKLSSSHPSARLFIAGKGPGEAQVREMLEDLRLSRAVTLLGLRTDIPDLLRAADAYLMSSAWEGLPLVLLEAAASQLPIVTTDVGGNSEIVQHGLNGFVVSPGQPQSLAVAMAGLMDLPLQSRSTMGANSRRIAVEQYCFDRVTDTWTRIYERLLENRRNGLKTTSFPSRS